MSDLWKRVVFSVLYPAGDNWLMIETVFGHGYRQVCTTPPQQWYVDILIVYCIVP